MMTQNKEFFNVTNSRPMHNPYRNQSTDLQYQSINWFQNNSNTLTVNGFTLSFVILNNNQTCVNTARFLNYVWPFFSIMNGRIQKV